MDLLNQNIAALKQYKPKFYESLQERLSEYIPGVESSGVLIDIARDGSPYMQYQFQDAMVRLNSNYNPSREADQWAGQYTFSQYNSTAILFGIGSGYFAEALLNRMQKTDHLILLEPKEEVFFECLHKIDLTKLIRDERTMFALGSPDTGNIFHLMVVFVHWANLSSMQVMKHPNYEKLFVNDNLLFDNEIRNFRMALRTEAATEEVFGKEVAYNTVRNLKYLPGSHHFHEFRDKFPEETAGIVVSAGPSLDKNISLLHEVKGKAIIMATDTALRRLHQENIVPDFVVSIDPKKPIWMFENAGFEEIPFFCKIDSNPEVLEMHRGKKIWVNPSSYFWQMYQCIGVSTEVFNSGGSVATTAFNLCNLLGLKNIVLIGQDLSFEGNVTHAGGEVIPIKYEEESICYVKGNNGDMVKTRGDWVVYLKWFERYIREINDGIRVINATEGGAYIHGTEVMTLREVIDTICSKNEGITDIIENVLNMNMDQYTPRMMEFINQSVLDIQVMLKAFDKAITLCNRFDRKYVRARTITPDITKCMTEIKKINKRVGDMPVYLLIDEIVKHMDIDSVKEIYANDEDEFSSMIKMMRNTKHIFELSLQAAKEIQPNFEQALQEMKQQVGGVLDVK